LHALQVRSISAKSSTYQGIEAFVKVSVIIPCYNAAETIGEQLEALASQRFNQPFEVIVVDNGSTDETIAAVHPFKKRFRSIRIIDASGKQGAAYARNMGAKSATGDMLLFCDADDVVADGWLQAMTNALMKDQFVAGRLRWLQTKDDSPPTGRPIPQRSGLPVYSYPPFLPHAASANLGVKKSVHERVGGFDESWGQLEDTDYCWRIQLTGVDLVYQPEAVVNMRARGTFPKMVRQSWSWGRYNVLLYKHYRSKGMPKLDWKTGIKKWLALLRHLPHLSNKNELYRWLWRIAWNLGRLEGCFRYRVLAI
jgi:glycosyltransferase involved in cell wall biosynthesis